MGEKLSAKASIEVLKPIEEVFEAIINPDKMSNYFIERSSGRLEEGVTVEWKFPEFEDIFPVTGKVIRSYDYISFDWSVGEEGMLVEIFLEAYQDIFTVVRIK